MGVTNAMWPRLGGPMGSHAAPRGVWFNPLPWILLAGTVVFLVLFLRHTPCVQVAADNAVNVYIRVCYSDIQATFLSQGFGQGVSAFGAEAMTFPPLTAAFIYTTQLIGAWVFGSSVYPGAALQEQVDASVVFFGLTAVGLFVCLLVTLLCLARLGRDSDARRPSWDAMMVAASPVVLAVGLINWDLFGIALTCLGMFLFARRAVVESGIVLGLAACAAIMPIAVVLAVTVACGLRGGWKVALRFAVPAVAAFFLVHLPLLIQDFDSVYAFYHGEINKDTGYGSLWYLASLMGASTRSTGSLAFVLLMLGFGILIAWLYVTHRTPRVGLLVAVMLLATCLLGPAYPPQTALWLLVAVYWARPYRWEMAAFTITQVAYYLAIWPWLNGSLTSAQSGPYAVYWLAILARAGVEAWLLVSCLRDIATPRRDLLRTPSSPDPIGGVLNDGETLTRVAPPVPADPPPLYRSDASLSVP